MTNHRHGARQQRRYGGFGCIHNVSAPGDGEAAAVPKILSASPRELPRFAELETNATRLNYRLCLRNSIDFEVGQTELLLVSWTRG